VRNPDTSEVREPEPPRRRRRARTVASARPDSRPKAITHGSAPRARREELPEAKFKNPDTAALVRRRLSEDSDDVDALFVLAVIRVRDGKVEEGITILDRVLKIDPRYPGGWRLKATLHRMQGQDDAERSAQRKADEAER